jgi:hypothetical protein
MTKPEIVDRVESAQTGLTAAQAAISRGIHLFAEALVLFNEAQALATGAREKLKSIPVWKPDKE